MPLYDPLASQFANVPLAPWQRSKKLFDFDDGFVAYIRKYLEARKLVSDVVSAKAWINKAKFGDGERYELCTLQWEAYQESLTPITAKPVLRAVGSDSDVSGGDSGGADQSDFDCAEPEIVPDLPDEFARLEGESSADYARRMMEISRAKIGKIGSW